MSEAQMSATDDRARAFLAYGEMPDAAADGEVEIFTAAHAPGISAVDPHGRCRATVLGTIISHVDAGSGDPIVFLHGNPTSSYLWRNVIPHVAPFARCIAPDLPGMGASWPTAMGTYRFADHARHLEAFFKKLGIKRRVTLVGHEWGAALGFHWAARHPEALRGIAYLEGIMRPLAWSDWPKPAVDLFKELRGPAGEERVLANNILIERILPSGIIRKLTEAEMKIYRRPFVRLGMARLPMLAWLREIPLAGNPQDTAEIAQSNWDWLAQSPVPKLFINGAPGAILTGAQRESCRKFPNQTEITVKGVHFLPEDSPHEIGRAIAGWYRSL